MAGNCTICSLPRAQLDAINAELLSGNGRSMQEIAIAVGLRAKSSVSTHKNQHIPKMLKEAARLKHETETVLSADSVTEDITRLKNVMMEALRKAEESDDERVLRETAKVLVSVLNLAAKSSDLINDNVEIHFNAAESQEFQTFVSIVMTTLMKHPEARMDVIEALKKAELDTGAWEK